MKIVQISLIVIAFFLILAAGLILNQNGPGSFNLAGFKMNSTQLAISLITSGVIFYFFGRLLGFIFKLKKKND